MAEILPLFPLNTVLFPKANMPLKIFEERYKQMIGECLEKGSGFGVCLIQEGEEAGSDTATPFEFGCACDIKKVNKLEGGEMKVTIEGTRRFRVIEELRRKPFFMAKVEWLDEEPGNNESAEAARDELRRNMSRYANLYYLITSKQLMWEKHFRDSVRLSWYLADLIDLENPEKQELLELPDAASRLNAEIPLLTRENERLEGFWGEHKYPRN